MLFGNTENKTPIFKSKKYFEGLLQEKGNADFLKMLKEEDVAEDADLDEMAKAYDNVDARIIGAAKDQLKLNNAIGDGASMVKTMQKNYTVLGQMGVKFKDFFTGLITNIGTSLIAGGISAAVTFGVGFLFDQLDKAFHPEKYIRENYKKAKDAVDDVDSSMKQNSDTVNNVKQRYAELAQEVNNLGTSQQNQGTLSNDEYAEFLNISNQLAEIFPELTNGYDENGNALLNLNGTVGTIVGSLDELLQKSQDIANAEFASQFEDLFSGAMLNVEDAQDKVDEYQEKMDSLNKVISDIRSGRLDESGDSYKFLDISKLTGHLENIYGSVDYEHLTAEQSAWLEKELKQVETEFRTNLTMHTTQLHNFNQEAGTYMSRFYATEANEFYNSLSGKEQELYKRMLDTYDYGALPDELGAVGKQSQAIKDINEQFEQLSKQDTDQVVDILNEINRVQNAKGVSYADRVADINEQLEILQKLLPNVPIDKLMELAQVDGFMTSRDKALNAWTLDDSVTTDRRNQTADYNGRKLRQEYERFINTLSDDRYDLWVAALNNGEIDEELLKKGTAAWNSFIDDLAYNSARGKLSFNTAMFESLTTALSEQKDQGYLTDETLQKLNQTYGDLQESLYTFTDNGVMLNTEAMQKYTEQVAEATLVSAELKEAVAVKEYNEEIKTIDRLTSKTQRLKNARAQGKQTLRDYVNVTKDLTDAERSELIASLDKSQALADEINGYDMLEAQIRATMSALNEYVKATETPNLSDNFNTAASAVENLKKSFESGWTGTDEFRKGMEYLGGYGFNPDIMEFGSDVYDENWADKVEEYIERGQRYFTEDISGIYNFLDDAVEKTEGMITKDAEGVYAINVKNIDEFAKRMDLSVSAATDLLLATSDAWDFDIDFDNISDSIVDGLTAISDESVDARQKMDDYKKSIEELKAAGYDVSSLEEELYATERRLNQGIDFELRLSEKSRDELVTEAESYAEDIQKAVSKKISAPFKIHFDSKDIDTLLGDFEQISEYRDTLTPDTEEWQQASTAMAALLRQKQELERPTIMDVDASDVEGTLSEDISLVQEFIETYNEVEYNREMKIDSSEADAAEEKLSALMKDLQGIENKSTLGLSGINWDTASAGGIVASIKEKTDSIDVNDFVKNGDVEVGADTTQAKKDVNVLVTAINNTHATVKTQLNLAPGAIISLRQSIQSSLNNQPFNIRVTTNGTKANPQHGSSWIGSAYGNSNVQQSGMSLVGELGEELLVRDGKVYPIGSNGAEVIPVVKGDIIFNAEQTRQLLSSHKINSRGQLMGSFASGTQYHGAGTGGRAGSSSWRDRFNVPSPGGSGNSGGGRDDQSADEAKETFDWIEVKIQRIEEEIARLNEVAENTYTLWSKRNKSLISEMDRVREEIDIQRRGYERYLQEANSVGLSEEYAYKVRNGLIDIETIKNNEPLVEKINLYQQWFNKAVECYDAVQTLTIKLGELAETKFDNIKSEFEELIAYATSYADIIDERISRTQEHGYFVSKDYYKELIKYENEELGYLTQEYQELIKKRDEAVASGAIEKGSSAWNSMNQEILSVEKAIEESTTALVKFNNEIRNLDWEIFDWIEGRISRITSEAQFLVDLMSNDKLYEDDGRLTNRGQATNGLFAVQYETAMRQALDYAEERRKLEKEIAKDPGNKSLIERYEQLVDAQQNAIKSAEQMKDAVKDLVEKGIQEHLSNLDKLIDKYQEVMDREKDMYDYSKNIEQQVKNINSMEKMLNAYAGDDSEEARKTIQQTQNNLNEAREELEETEWEKMISETKELISKMRQEYEEVLMARLDDVDALMHDMIDNANENTAIIKDTIKVETDKVAYTITKPLNDILNSNKISTLVSDFMNKFDTNSTAVKASIDQIKAYVYSMTDAGKAQVEAERQAAIKKAQQIKAEQEAKARAEAAAKQKAAEAEKAKQQAAAKKQAAAKAAQTPKRSEKDYYGVALAIWNGNYGWGSGQDRFNRLRQKGFDADKVQNIVNQMGREGYIYSGAWVGRYHGIRDLSPYHYNKFAKGSKKIPHDQLAWTQEKGQELIYRTGDGAMLTPLGSGDMVFTNEMAQRLWELSKTDVPTAKDIQSIIPHGNGNGNTINNQNAISINLPNVKNYEQFKEAMKKDGQFSSFIQEITFGQATGHNSLMKNRF